MTVRALTTADFPQIADLLDECFGLQTHDQLALVRWKYAQSNKRLIAYGAFDHQRLVAFYSNSEYHIQQGRRDLAAAICLDMATRPAYRGQGLIRTLSQRVYADVQQQQFELSFGFSNAAGVQVDRHSRNYGYTVVGQFKTRYTLTALHHATPLRWRITQQVVKPKDQPSSMFILDQQPQTVAWRYQQKPETTYLLLDILDEHQNELQEKKIAISAAPDFVSMIERALGIPL